MRKMLIPLFALLASPTLAAGPTPPAAPAPQAQPAAPPLPKCPEDAEGGACVWGKVEGFDGGSVQMRGLHIALAGVMAPARRDLCASKASKEEFDCARPARKRMGEMTAKGLACEIVETASGFLWGRCRNADGDLGRQLVQAGLARAAKDGPHAEAQKQAVRSRKGLWAADMILPRDWESARRKAESEDE